LSVVVQVKNKSNENLRRIILLKKLNLYFKRGGTGGDFMNMNRKDIAEKWKRLAERILEDEGDASLESLKAEHLSIYEDLVRLGMLESQDEQPNESVESNLERPEPVQDAPEPLSEEDEVILETPGKETDPPNKADPPKKAAEEQEYPTLSDLFVPTFNDIKEDMSQKEEFKDTVSLDETEKLFETRKEEIRQLSLNDRLVSNSIQIGLNDRIAFVNKLFNFSQSDFNKVLTHLNACSSRDQALHYVQYQVKTNYNWKGKEDLEERFISLIERKFMT